MKALGIGDPVEVKKVRFNGLTTEPYVVYATVCYIDKRCIGVVYKDGTRELFLRESRSVAKVDRSY